jgi:glycosyltransferase involved in cell wall biosynthesis
MLRKADIFILITKHEGLPLTVLEAMSAGLPVIASAVGGIPEEIDSTSGILIQENNIEEITEALKHLIENQSERSTMGANGRKIIEQKFSLNKFLSETEKIYREAASRS